MKRFKVPERGEEPSEDFIDALNELEIGWEGDDEGLTFCVPFGDTVFARPGETVVIYSSVHVEVVHETK